MIEKEITKMGKNKTAGGDQIHVKIMKANAQFSAAAIAKCWKSIAKTRTVLDHWIQGKLVQLFK